MTIQNGRLRIMLQGGQDICIVSDVNQLREQIARQVVHDELVGTGRLPEGDTTLCIEGWDESKPNPNYRPNDDGIDYMPITIAISRCSIAALTLELFARYFVNSYLLGVRHVTRRRYAKLS